MERRGGTLASTRFTVLTGHLSQYSLADLLGILRHQRKTGRLLIEYVGSPAILFFKDGNLVDAQYNSLIGVQAIFVAFVQPPAAFNFNPLIQPTRDSIDYEQQRVILELLGCWTEEPIHVKSVTPRDELSTHDVELPEIRGTRSQLILPAAPMTASNELPEAGPVLALPAGPSKWSTSLRSIRRPWVLALATFCLLLVFGVPTLIAINNKARKVSASPTSAQLQGATTQAATPAPNVVSVEQNSPKAGADNTNFGPEKNREQVQNKPRPDESLKDTASVPTTTKETAQTDAGNAASTADTKTKQPTTAGQSVKVVMRIENGRVVQATVGDRRPGSEAFEALALRIARQRRYPAGVSKQETFVMKVDGPK